MKILTTTVGLTLALAVLAPAFAQNTPAPIPPNNATIQGTEGPNSNSTGYPSAAGGVNIVTSSPPTTAQIPPATR